MYQAELFLRQQKPCVLSELAREYDAHFDIEIEELHDEKVTFVLTSTEHTDAFECRLRSTETVHNVDRLANERLLVTKRSCGAYDAVCRNHGVLRRNPNQISASQRRYNVLVFQHEDLRAIVRDFQEIGTVTLGKLTEVGTTASTLTDRQREILQYALESGYFEWPREKTAAQLASDFDISRATFLEHLRKAERKVLTDAIDDGIDGRRSSAYDR